MISLIATVYNEADTIRPWLATLDAQTRRPDEIVIVDAGSDDGTLDVLEERAARDPSFHVHVHPGANVPHGRNLAIAAASGDVIAITDAGTHARPDWLERLAAPLEDPAVDVSAGFFAPAGRTDLEYVLATVITPRRRDVDPATFLPSSRSVALRKTWWERVGGYPDWLRAGEDLVFSMRLREAGANVALALDAVVEWYPRPTLAGFSRQYHHYARGDGHAHMFFKRHAARYTAYALGTALLAAATRRPAALALLAAGAVVHLGPHARRIHEEQPFAGEAAKTAWAYAMVPVVVVTGDVAKMRGFPKGLWERWRAGDPEALFEAPIASHRVRGDAS